jgi:transposase
MDLKQFMVSMLCVEGNIPISGKMQDGNSSDEKLNNEELQRIGKLLSPLKDNIGELIYVADCKLICAGNMALLDDLLFISRFPGNFKEHNIAVERAIDADDWEELGVLAETPSPSKKRQRANYRSHETAVIIEGKSYRALVIQTDHLDKRRTNGIENRKAKERKLVEKAIKSAEKTTYHCQEDARKALEILSVKRRTNYWNIKGSMEIIQVHAPGRAPKTGNRKIVDTRYRLLLAPDENTGHYQSQMKMAGCFVMISNVSKERMTAREVLKTYKEQYGVEQNFSFLKEPLIANDTFLKKPSRIDALTFILLVSLMIWNLIQRELRNSAEVRNGELNDLNKRPTSRPTGYLMMNQLSGTIILRYGISAYSPATESGPKG